MMIALAFFMLMVALLCVIIALVVDFMKRPEPPGQEERDFRALGHKTRFDE